MTHDMILVIDCGTMVSRFIARLLRGEGVYSEITKAEKTAQAISAKKPKGLIIIGDTAESLNYDDLPDDLPLLAVGKCSVDLCKALGGNVTGENEINSISSVIYSSSKLFDGLAQSNRKFQTLYSLNLPGGFSELAYVDNGSTPAFGSEIRRIYGLQFSIEQNDPEGLKILSNFAKKICRCTDDWSLEAFAEETIRSIQEQVGDGRALIALSGGVDTCVCAALMHKAIGDKLICVFVDSGLMREDEAELISRSFPIETGCSIEYIDAKTRFLDRLRGVKDANRKREVVRDEMLHTVAEATAAFGKVDCLAEGTIYPDILAGTFSDSDAAKDRNALMDHIDFEKLLEPIKMLFKGEVRRLGGILGLSADLTSRQPFPEAGLAVRCLGEVTEERIDILSRADAIFREEIKAAELETRIWQYFAILTDMKVAGIYNGDEAYGYALILRAVTSNDALSANAFRLPSDLLERVMERVTNEVSGITRVLYDVTKKPPALIEWE